MILDVKIDVGIRKSFSSDFNRKYDLCWEAGCVENIVNTMVFNRFHVYRQIEFSMSWASFLESFWEVFGVLGVTFGGLRGYRNIVENSSKFRGFPGTPGSEGIRQVEGGKSRPGWQ